MKSLPGFAVNRVGSAPGAELFQFDTTGRVLLVLDRRNEIAGFSRRFEFDDFACTLSHGSISEN